MKRAKSIKPVALAMFLVSTLFSLAYETPASAQGGFVEIRVATFSGFPVYSLNLLRQISPDVVLLISDSFQPTSGGVTGNLLDVGVWYHTSLANPVILALGVGFTSEHGPFPGFGFANTSGYSIGAGVATLRFTNDLFGYVSERIVTLGGTSNSVLDLGLALGNLELGYINFAGSGAPYLGFFGICVIFC
jgi:hypothetical protein